MPYFDIRHHIWNVYEIDREQKLSDIYSAFELFMTNVKLGTARYKGATKIDYVDMNLKWKNTRKKKQDKQRRIFEDCITRNYHELLEAWNNNDRERFEYICLMDRCYF